jgi:hypothetical protein
VASARPATAFDPRWHTSGGPGCGVRPAAAGQRSNPASSYPRQRPRRGRSVSVHIAGIQAVGTGVDQAHPSCTAERKGCVGAPAAGRLPRSSISGRPRHGLGLRSDLRSDLRSVLRSDHGLGYPRSPDLHLEIRRYRCRCCCCRRYPDRTGPDRPQCPGRRRTALAGSHRGSRRGWCPRAAARRRAGERTFPPRQLQPAAGARPRLGTHGRCHRSPTRCTGLLSSSRRP